ncbi:MAG: HesA/MoeB/ThiF family protein [Planctomycetaceae bacterium]|nr:HesA/MoeB/ThiF family protein [Planctomycetaceae bacterium]
MAKSIPLTDTDRGRYQWQMWTPQFGQAGQEKLKGASVLISRVGGLGGVAALELAAAGVGRLVLAHGGNVTPSDLNRQILMSEDWLGKPRVESARRRLLEFNPHIEVEAVASNITEANAAELVNKVDLVLDAAPLFEERFLMNRQAVGQGKVLVDAAMYDTSANLTTIIPGRTPCLACLYREAPPAWKRQFPVFGACSGAVACLAAMEAIKAIAGFGELLAGQLLVMDVLDMQMHKMQIARRADCPVCGHL